MDTTAATAVLHTLIQGNQLKRTARTGWGQRGVVPAEDVAAHSYGVVFTALVLAQVSDEAVDLGRTLAMATLHDLPEGLTSDIPSPAWRYLPAGIKIDVERRAMSEILASAPYRDTLLALWEELHRAETAEARLVDDADKLDLFLQALMYEQQTGNQQLAEFWAVSYQFYTPQAQAIYKLLREQREGSNVVRSA
jgi:putative hydrolases of HD superfamily